MNITTGIILLGVGGALIILVVIGFSSQWFQNRAIKKIQAEYLGSLEQEYMQEDKALSEVVYDADIQETRVVHYHQTLQ